MKANLSLDMKKFNQSMKTIANDAEIGALDAVEFSVDMLRDMTLAQVPKDTKTLGDSYESRIFVRGKEIRAEFGYGGNGDPVNPKTGKPASQYMLTVHEDLEAYHPIGNAKFFENPLQEFAREFEPGAARIILRRIRRGK